MDAARLSRRRKTIAPITYVVWIALAVRCGDAGDTCRPETIAGHYVGHVCVLSTEGIRSIPNDSIALRMVLSRISRHSSNWTLPSLPKLHILEYEVGSAGGQGGGLAPKRRSFVRLRNLDTLQLFHSVGNTPAFSFQLNDGLFQGLGLLRQLILSDLGLDSLPVGIFRGLHGMRILELNQNRLTRIPPNTFTGCCQTLSTLNLYGNRIADLGFVSWRGLPSLRILNLGDNRLTVLRESNFDGLGNVTDMDVTRNNLFEIEPNAFAGLDSLLLLDLRDNNLTSSNDTVLDANATRPTTAATSGIRRGSFWGLPSLENLEIVNNQIAFLQCQTFDGLHNLRKLDLSGNRIHTVPENSLEPLPCLTELILSGNRLATLGKGLHGAFVRLSTVDLSSNPWHCDSNLHWLVKWLHKAARQTRDFEAINLENTKCSTPVSNFSITEAYGSDENVNDEDDQLTLRETENTREVTETWSSDGPIGGLYNPTTETSNRILLATQGASILLDVQLLTTSKSIIMDNPLSLATQDSTDMPHLHLSTDLDVAGTSRAEMTKPLSHTTTEAVSENTPTADTFWQSKIENMRTFESLLSSVTNNMRTLDSLMQTATDHIRTLNSLLSRTIVNTETTDAGRLECDNRRKPEAKSQKNSSSKGKTSLQLAVCIICGLILRHLEWI